MDGSMWMIRLDSDSIWFRAVDGIMAPLRRRHGSVETPAWCRGPTDRGGHARSGSEADARRQERTSGAEFIEAEVSCWVHP